jgi:hypothetical protein
MSRSGGVMFCQVPTVPEQLATGTKGESISGAESTVDESPGGDDASSPFTGIDPSVRASGAEPLDVAPQATSSKPRAP